MNTPVSRTSSTTTTIQKDISTTSTIPSVSQKKTHQQLTQQQNLEKQNDSPAMIDTSPSPQTHNSLLADEQKSELLRLNVLLDQSRRQYSEIKKKKRELQV